MRILCWFALCILSAIPLNTQERITTFMSDITVKTDATLRIQETIEVVSAGTHIIHGIVREFPTSYRDHHGLNYNVDFDVHSVTHNGDPAPFWIESVANGKKLYIGEKGVRISKGKHIYTIIYTTNRQLGFFNDHDELYWNVTGNGWRLPIDTVRVSVQLPPNVPSSSITAEGYTGAQSEQGKNYTHAIKGDRITFFTTRSLQPYQGFTIAVTWPKGFVHEPSERQKWYWFVRDNLILVWTLLAFLLLLLLILYTVLIARHKNKPGTVIPLFYPPADFTPSVVGFMKEREFKNQLLAADIVNLAVHGFITISCAPAGFLGSGTYTLKLVKDFTSKDSEHMSDYEVTLLSALFGPEKYSVNGDTLVISEKNAEKIDAALQKSSKQCETQASTYIVELRKLFYLGCAVCAFWCVGDIAFGSLQYETRTRMGYSLFFLVLLTGAIRRFYRVYTTQGRKIQDQIDGFELYLTTAEVERMKIIGTPPTKTPELYEKYLPYAVALGVEKQWTQKFASVFAALAQQGHAYTPIWYTGRPFTGSSFASGVSSSLNSAIASASQSPGSSSGSKGGGSSGGGGGGGGGGGW